MRVVVVGGGKVGFYLVRTLLDKHHQVSVVETDPRRAALLAEQLSALVICGDGTNPAYLADAGADQAQVLAAVTGLDEVNLIACQVAREEFGVGRTIARVNNPKNQAILRQLGVDIAVSSTSIIARLIEREASMGALRELLTFHRGEMALVEAVLQEGSPAAGRRVRELAPHLPQDSVLVAVVRGDHIIFPRGDTQVLPQDGVVALTTTEREGELMRALVGVEGRGAMSRVRPREERQQPRGKSPASDE
ncbi:MAG TPA: TrkA family potassium uptake protein [Firmicutes bacterium]|nr:TrkA family potassium uptake protein [Bacillota bacterium]